ncbi:MAG: TAXI family TRAP transporter solute-binding subunit, partial [Planctomycetota bacterium]
MERLHVLYYKKAYSTFMRSSSQGGSQSEPSGDAPRGDDPVDEKVAGPPSPKNSETQSKDPDKPILRAYENGNVAIEKRDRSFAKFLSSEARLSIGPVGSGTKILTEYILSALDIAPNKIQALSASEGLEKLGTDIDVLFIIAGAPEKKIQQKLEASEEFGLVEISPTVVRAIRDRFGVQYRIADFIGKYKGDAGMTATIGTFAFLITSRDVPSSAANEVLRSLYRGRNDLPKGVDVPDRGKLPLQEIDFISNADQTERRSFVTLVRNILLFVTSVAIGTALSFRFLAWTLSSLRSARTLRRVSAAFDGPYHAPALAGAFDPEQYAPTTPEPISEQTLTKILNQTVFG